VAQPRLVLDTNLVLSALVCSSERAARWRMMWQRRLILPLVSQATAAELMRALAYPKFKLGSAEQEELLADYLPSCEVVSVPQPPPVTPPCRDPADTAFLILALAGKADAIVTGDKDWLALAGIFACPILTTEAGLQVSEKWVTVT